ncbi:MAG: glycosyltransferase family 39 protein [Fuerstia sp.]|nr:glycosyltransferase family 39 protein [Fuerstiella sp.]
MSTERSTLLQKFIRIALLICLVLVIAWIGGGRYLLQRQLWMDEVHSWLLIQEPQTQRSLQALADGVDYNPPTYMLLARQLHYLPGGITESSLRWLSLTLMMLAIIGIFVLLQRRFSFLVCLAAVLMMASSVHLIHQSTEIRFYPLWCAACAWLCVVLDSHAIQKPRRQRLNNILAIVLAGVITTTHYFGILTLGLICVGAMLAPNITRGRRRIIVLVALAGGLCLVACLPFLIGQRAALTRSTWVSPATVDDSIGFLSAMFPLVPIVVCGLAFAISSALRKSGAQHADLAVTEVGAKSAAVHTAAEHSRQLAPSLLLALMPLVIVLLSWTVQPALVTRYAVPGVLGFAAIFAILLSRCGPRFQMLMVVAGGVMFLRGVAFCSHQWHEIDRTRDELVAQLKDLPADGPIVFEDRTVSMPVLHSHPELHARCSLLDFTDDQLTADSRLRIVQRDVGRRIVQWYPAYTMSPLDSLDNERTFFVIPYLESPSASPLWPADHRRSSVSPGIDRYDRSPSETSTAPLE